MGLINCNKLLTVGVQQFDDDHCQLVEITNQLHTAIKAGNGNEAVLSVLQQLIEFACTHFEAEETLLSQHDFPCLAEHRQAHQAILQQLEKFLLEAQDAQTSIQHTLMQFLLDWLIFHTKNLDQQYGAFLNGKGIH